MMAKATAVNVWAFFVLWPKSIQPNMHISYLKSGDDDAGSGRPIFPWLVRKAHGALGPLRTLLLTLLSEFVAV